MGAAQFNLKPETVLHNFQVLANLQESSKLRTDEQGKLTLEDRIAVSFRRKDSDFKTEAVAATFKKAIEMILQESPETVNKNYVAEIKEKFNDAVQVGLVRQMKLYHKEKKANRYESIALIIEETVKEYNKYNPYPIQLYRAVKDLVEEILMPLKLKQAVVPAAPEYKAKRKEKKEKPELTAQEKRIQEAILKGTLSRAPVGFVTLQELGKINLRSVGIRIAAERKRTAEEKKLFDESLLAKARARKADQGVTAGQSENEFITTLSRRRKAVSETGN